MSSLDLNTPLRLSVAVVAVLVAYYFAPIGAGGPLLLVNLLVTLMAVALCVYVVRALVLTYLDDSVEHGAFGTLAALLIVVVVLFSMGYYLVEYLSPGQFSGLSDRTDALYFSMTTLTTTGFGDIHAQGNLARIMVTGQMFFDLVFLATVGAVVSNRLGMRIARKRSE
ncbi:MAG TPA: potassium channel family protein [Ornithinimicrobium sp.]|uniref:potassium channel family protein n=1 Tax=Ornithinimicrobium sp. TaxID=1977084 RepID=UPI002B482592|nr:potassium channel family protein [Ornithinimicrobium sp.]HKJ11178.1 potassium channel family protein [Ornithinimicrobium sp.]